MIDHTKKFFFIKTKYNNPVTNQIENLPNIMVCLEKLYFDLYSFFGVFVPKSYIVQIGKQLGIASQKLPTYKDFSEIIDFRITYKKKESNSGEGELPELIEICEYQKEMVKSPYIHSEGIDKIIQGKEVFLAAAALLLDIDAIGYYFDNIGVIEYPEYFNIVKIDPGECYVNLSKEEKINYQNMLDNDLANGYIIKSFKDYNGINRKINLHFEDFFSCLTEREKLIGIRRVCKRDRQQLYHVIFNPKIPFMHLPMEIRKDIYDEITSRLDALENLFLAKQIDLKDIDIVSFKSKPQNNVVKDINRFIKTDFFARKGTSKPQIFLKKSKTEFVSEIKAKL